MSGLPANTTLIPESDPAVDEVRRRKDARETRAAVMMNQVRSNVQIATQSHYLDSLTDAIENYNASILEDNAAKRGKAFGSGSGGFPRDHHVDRHRDHERGKDHDRGRGRTQSPKGKNDDPFAAHNEDFMRRNRKTDDDKDGRHKKGKSKHSDSGRRTIGSVALIHIIDDKEPEGEEEGEEDDDCKCVVS